MKFTLLHRNVDISVPPKITDLNVVHDDFRFESTFKELYKFMSENVEVLTDKDDGNLLIPVSFKHPDEGDDYSPAMKSVYENGEPTGEKLVKYRDDGRAHVQRAYPNIETVECLIIDYDGGCTIEDALELWSGYNIIVYTTFNHLVDRDNGEGSVDRFRVMVRMLNPISIDAYHEREDGLIAMAGGASMCDETTFTRGRGFFWPCYGEHNKDDFILEMLPGKPIDVMGVVSTPKQIYLPKPVQKPKYAGDDSRVEQDRLEMMEELKNCSFPSYKQWFQIVEAMKQSGFTQNEMLEVTCGNTNHATTTSGVPDNDRCLSHWHRASEFGEGEGKLVSIIRLYGNPLFRTKGYRKNREKQSLDAEIASLEKRIKERKKKERLIEATTNHNNIGNP